MVPSRRRGRGEFGERLRELRLRAKLTQQQLSEKSGVQQASLARLESGTVPSPRLPTARKLAAALGVPLTELFSASVGAESIEKAIREYQSLPEAAAQRATEEELDWLRRLPAMVWLDEPAAGHAIYHLIQYRRVQAATRRKGP